MKIPNHLKQQVRNKQHHVWGHYLGAWKNDGRVFVLNHDANNIFDSAPESVAKIKRFYRIEKVDDIELGILLGLIDRMPAERKGHIRTVILEILAPIIQSQMGFLDEPESVLDDYKTNALELYHSDIEARAISFLTDLRAGSLDFMECDENSFLFYNYLTHQIMRTRTGAELVKQPLGGFDFSNICGLLSIATSLNFAKNLFENRKHYIVQFLSPTNSCNLITGDQPAINLAGDTAQTSGDTCIYYPVGPRAAVLIHSPNYQHCLNARLSDHDVFRLNKAMTKEAVHNTFALERNDLLSK